MRVALLAPSPLRSRDRIGVNVTPGTIIIDAQKNYDIGYGEFCSFDVTHNLKFSAFLISKANHNDSFVVEYGFRLCIHSFISKTIHEMIFLCQKMLRNPG